MALTAFQIGLLRLLAERRAREGVSYVAGGAALNFLLKTGRRSRDIDLFHDTTVALQATWDADKATLTKAGHTLDIVRQAPSFIEALVIQNDEQCLVQWTRDSAFRFFPLVQDELLGLTLHPVDLATNKILALAGRLEPRDWIDTIECHRGIQPLGYLVWAACGKDPGVSPEMVFSEASRLHYAQAELDALDFGGNTPLSSALSAEWRAAVADGRRIAEKLPDAHAGECVLTHDRSALYRGSAGQIEIDLRENAVAFHAGRVGGAWPEVVG